VSTPDSATKGTYCAVCGGRTESGIRRGTEVFCSEAHAEEFEREVAVARASREVGR
jgi:hypothetical protein